MLLQEIILACWVIFALYWLVASWSVKPTQEKIWHIQQFRLIIVAYIVLFFLASKLGFLYFSLLLPSPILPFIGTFFVVCGLSIAILARKKLANNWSGSIDLKKDHELITTGIYKYLRHPIYTGILCMVIGTVLVYTSPVTITFFLVLLALFIFKIWQEEKLMTIYFPDTYPVYKKRVKALIPFLI